MEDLIKIYGGIPNLKKNLYSFYEKVCEEKKVKHYFFGINIDHAIQDVINFRSFVMRKPEHLYGSSPQQTAPASIKVRIMVFEEVLNILQVQLQSGLKVNWKDAPRFAYHIMEIFEESRCKSMDSVRMTLERDFVTTTEVNSILTKLRIRTKLFENGDLMVYQGWGLAYPFVIKLSQEEKLIKLVGKGYTKQGTKDADGLKVLGDAKTKFPFYEFSLKEDAEGKFIETTHSADYSAAGIPVRLLLTLSQSFSQCFEEVMALDKNQHLINLVRDK
jgi:hypothetical protein